MSDPAIAAAREALQPIRDLLEECARETKPPCDLHVRLGVYGKTIDRISAYCFAEHEYND